MKRVAIAVAWVGLTLALAGNYSQFENKLLTSSQRLAQLEQLLESARRRLQVLSGDPYAAPLERDEAADALARARAQLKRQRLELRKEAFRLWTDVLLARARLQAAQAAEEVMEIRLRAARIRVEKGAASPLELDAAQRAYERASLQGRQAQATLEAALQALAALTDVKPDEVPRVTPPAKLGVGEHPDLLLARLDVRALERAVAAASGPDTPRLELEGKTAELASARERATRLRERLRRRLEILRLQYQRQQRLIELARSAVNDAQKKLEAQRLRWDQGLASRLDLSSAQQALAQERADEVAAAVELGRLALELWAYAEAP